MPRTPNSELRTHLRGLTIGFIGAGTMGQALIKGLRARGVPARALVASDPSADIRRTVRRRLGVRMVHENGAIARWADVVILAVKPQQMSDAVAEFRPHLRPGRLVISVAAGITLGWLRRRLPGVPLVRVMPNLPATVGCGFAGVAAARGTSRRHRAIALAIFRAVGEAVELPERRLNALTAVSGSGPAYVFFLVDAWQRAAAALGLPAAVASAAIHTTLAGSVRLLGQSGEPAAQLIRRVASKRGTTEAALKVLARRRVAAHFTDALRAAAQRARELQLPISDTFSQESS